MYIRVKRHRSNYLHANLARVLRYEQHIYNYGGPRMNAAQQQHIYTSGGPRMNGAHQQHIYNYGGPRMNAAHQQHKPNYTVVHDKLRETEN